MNKKVIDFINKEAVVYYEGGYAETVILPPPSDSIIKPGEALKASKIISSGSHITENPLVQRELHFY
ncbi:hypothetical protein ACPWSR_10190 [Alloiococcus sp. CFN-8]|uniref:hypothetical protein n=1 Tax=Alloiococcus sp. CFN-8 TaxID=3416081 RepID=UPI003CF5824E